MSYRSLGRNFHSIQDPGLRRFLEVAAGNLDDLNERVNEIESNYVQNWFHLQMQNGWITYNASNNEVPEYMKDAYGWVHIRGEVSGGTFTNGTIVAMLPEGNRPRHIWPINLSHNGSTGAMLEVHPHGDIICQGLGGNTRLILAGTFYAQL